MANLKNRKIKPSKLNRIKKNIVDSRKHPAPGYPEKNPKNKKDVNIMDHPENQNTG